MADPTEQELQEMLARVQASKPTTKLLAIHPMMPECRIGKPPPFTNADGSKIGSVVSEINIIVQQPNPQSGEVMPTYQVQVFVKGQPEPRIFVVPQMACVPEMMLQHLVVPETKVPLELVRS